jgi:hypothetical protein
MRFKMKRQFFILMMIAMLIIVISPAIHAAKIEGTYYDDINTAGDKTLELAGVGLLRYWGFKAYTGAFYLEEGFPIEEALSDRAKRIEIEYMRPIKGKDFGPATKKGIKKNVSSEVYNRLRPQIEYHNSLYEDVKPGDRYSLTYIPGRGTELALNGEPKGTIEGAEFAAAVFSIWLGSKPIDKTFKKQIMGR